MQPLPLCTDETMIRLREEAKFFLDGLAKAGARVGSAEMVSFDTDWADQEGVGRFGRMTSKDGQFKYHAAPKVLERKENFDFQSTNVMSFVDAWQAGRKVEVPVQKLLSVDFPIPKEPKIQASSYHEERIFRKLVSLYKITLVNPSFKCMVALSQVTSFRDPGLIYLSSQLESEDWEWDIKDFVANSGGRLRLVTEEKIEGICYLGSADPVWYPKTSWFRFVPSPFNEPTSDYKGLITKFDNSGMYCTYQRRGRTVSVSLVKDEPTWIFNPESVDLDLGFEKKDSKKFFLESNFHMQIKEKCDNVFFHKPFFLERMGEWQGLKNRLGNVIYDVKGNGTYLSRRARAVLSEGEQWAPLVEVGRYMITFASLTPQVNPDVIIVAKGKVEVMSVDGSIPIWPLKEIWVKQSLDIREEDDLDPTRQILPGPVLGVKDSPIDNEYARLGDLYFPHDTYHETSMVWTPVPGSFLPSPYGKQNFRFLPGYSRGEKYGQDYIDVSELGEGFHCVATNMKSMAASIPNLNKYYSKMWTGRLAWSHLPVSAEDGSMVVTNVVLAQIVEYMQDRSRHRPIPITSKELSRTLGYSVSLVEYYCGRSSDIMYWEPGIKGNTTWLLRKNLTMTLLNLVTIGTQNPVRLTYIDALNYLLAREKISTTGSFGFFYYFLRYNRIKVNVEVKPDGPTTMFI